MYYFVMRRADPTRIWEARRAAVRNRLTDDERVSGALAERWLCAWDAEAGRRGIDRLDPDYWRDGTGWIDAERTTRRNPDDD